MKSTPIVPAEVDFSDTAAPAAPAFGDVYHSRAGALAQARHVFLGGNDLPRRWAGRARFVILETGFGLGNNFLATWDAWRQDPVRSERLVFVSIEKHPLRLDDLRLAHADSPLPELVAQLLTAWPPLTAGLHALSFEDGRVQLLLALGDVHRWSRELVADDVDAFYLDGFSPASNPQMWDGHLLKALGRRAAAGATAATWSVAPAVRDGLAAAGFEVERRRGFANKGGMAVATHRPQHRAQRPAAREPLAADARHALIVGAGLAGAACAWALARQGIASTVLDARPGPAQGGSGNPAGLFHGTLNPDDGPHARFNRAAALQTERVLSELPALPWLQRGLLRLELERGLAQMQRLIERQQLPGDYVRALSVADASAACGLALQHDAWFYPGGGALSPGDYVAALLRSSGAELQFGVQIAGPRRQNGRWQLLDAAGRPLAEAPLLVLAGGHDGLGLLQALAPTLPLTRQRGQLSHLRPAIDRPRLPVAGIGYAIADRADGLWCGATGDDEDMDPALRDDDQRKNLQQWARLSATATAIDEQPLSGRVGWRLLTPDRLPLVGGLPLPGHQGRQDQARFIPRLPGLAVCTALGSRGIAWAALCAQVVAAQATGAPCPLESSLVDAIDPARFAVRAAR